LGLEYAFVTRLLPRVEVFFGVISEICEVAVAFDIVTLKLMQADRKICKFYLLNFFHV